MSTQTTEAFLMEMFDKCVNTAFEKGELTEDMKAHFLSRRPETLDELDQAYKELKRAIDNHQYYQLLARIEKAEEVIDAEKDMAKRSFYVKKMKELAEQLERIIPA